MEKIFKVIQNDRDSELDEIIKNKPQLINWRDKQGLTLLHRAAQLNVKGCILGRVKNFIKPLYFSSYLFY